MFFSRFIQFSQHGLKTFLDFCSIIFTVFGFIDYKFLVFGYNFKYLYCHLLTFIDKRSHHVKNSVNFFQRTYQCFFYGLELFQHICLQIKILLENKICMVMCSDDFCGFFELTFQVVRIRL